MKLCLFGRFLQYSNGILQRVVNPQCRSLIGRFFCDRYHSILLYISNAISLMHESGLLSAAAIRPTWASYGFFTRVSLLEYSCSFLSKQIYSRKSYSRRNLRLYTLVISYAVNQLGLFGGARLTYRNYFVIYLDIR